MMGTKQPYKVIRNAVSTAQLTREGGAQLIEQVHRAALGTINKSKKRFDTFVSCWASEVHAEREPLTLEEVRRTRNTSPGLLSSSSDLAIRLPQPCETNRKCCGTGTDWSNHQGERHERKQFLFRDVTSSFSAQSDAGYMSAAASSWETPLGSPTFFEDGLSM